MRYWFGYLTAGIFAAITWLLTRFGERYATLVDMVYPYVVRTLQEYLANWTGQFTYPVWQALAVVLGMLILASLVLVLVLKWNPIQWLGWVLAVFSGIYLLHMAGEGFHTLTYEKHYPVFAGCTLPVKKLGWADMYTSMGITGFTFGITGEACVNPQIPDVLLPFTMCHEMAHRMCIASERDANFAAFLACSVHSDPNFQYSAYFMAFRYCYSALASVNTQAAAAAAARVKQGVGDTLRTDWNAYDAFFNQKQDTKATHLADTMNDTYLKTSGEKQGISSYAQVCDLLVNWHIQTVVLPSITQTETRFDPYDRTKVDLSGIVNAKGGIG